jgi:hypothetical protein
MLDHIFLSVSDVERSIAFLPRRWLLLASPHALTMTAKTDRLAIQT